MTIAVRSKPILLAAALGIAGALLPVLAAATDPWGEVRTRRETIVGTMSCTSASCHGAAESSHGTAGVFQRQYVHWLGANARYADGRPSYDPRAQLVASDADPHAMAAQRILEPRFQEVLRRASVQGDELVDGAMYQRCAKCHDPLRLTVPVASSAEQTPLPLGEGGERSELGEGLQLRAANASNALIPALSRREREALRGIGCESCHGGARDWIAVHYELGVSREHLVQLGMVDTKNLFVRARQCAACHVGSGDQDMNHDMIAAGHPPLRFELASYEALIPRKHWDDRPRRIGEPDYEVQLWAAGRVAAADAALALLESRARRAADSGQGTGDRRQGTGLWPEFAEANCFACHQPLRGDSDRSPVKSRDLGRRQALSWRTWDVALSPLLVWRGQFGARELPMPSAPSADSLERLRAEMNASLSPLPKEIATRAAAARTSLHEQARVSPAGSVCGPDGSPLDAGTVLRGLGAAERTATWDDACQRLAALVAVERSLYDRGSMDATDHDDFLQRIKSLAVALRFKSSGIEWPVVFSPGGASLAEVVGAMDNLRGKLSIIAAREATR